MRRLCPSLHGHGPPITRLFILVFVVVVVSVLAYRNLLAQAPLRPVEHAPPADEIQALNHPSFADVRQYERALPQHRKPKLWTKQRPRYLFFPWEAWGTGWNNVFQEQLLNTHLGYLSNRAYVFVDYIARDHPPFPDVLPNGTQYPLHIPMNALTSGPTGGGSWGPAANPSAPRPISEEWWNTACPPSEVVEIHTLQVNEEFNITSDTSGEERMLRWATKLRDIEAECLKVVDGTPFDFWFMNTLKIASVWKSYGESPTLKEYAWSPLVTRAVARNFALFSSGSLPPALSAARWRLSNPSAGDGAVSRPYPLGAYAPFRADTPPIRGLLGLHIRRGDYLEHCPKLADANMDYNTWDLFGRPDLAATNQYPKLPDYLDVPEGMSRKDAVLVHCWPSIDAIIERVRTVRASTSSVTAPGYELTAVYLATNAEREWVADLSKRLRDEGYALVSSSLDMQLALDEFAVSQAVDMAVLMAAQVFIGNGFSSLTSNVVQLRLAGGRDPKSSRFW